MLDVLSRSGAKLLGGVCVVLCVVSVLVCVVLHTEKSVEKKSV